MAKAQTDIRTTSYDALAARPFGYQGTIDDVIAQIRSESDDEGNGYWPSERSELKFFLGVDKIKSAGPSVELDQDVRYGADAPTALGVNDPGFFGISNAELRGWLPARYSK